MLNRNLNLARSFAIFKGNATSTLIFSCFVERVLNKKTCYNHKFHLYV